MPLEQIAEFLQKQLRAVERKIDHRLMQIEDARNFIWIWNIPYGSLKQARQSPWYFGERQRNWRKGNAFLSGFAGNPKEKLKITGFSREITLIDYGITGDTDKFVTEIQIPVK